MDETADLVRIKAMVVGQRYRIRLHDCCLQGELIGTYQSYDAEADALVFEIGRIGPSWGAWTAELL